MRAEEVAGSSKPTRWLTLTAVAFWALLALAMPLAALTLNVAKIAGFPLGFWFAAQGSFIGLSVLAIVFAWRAKGVREGEPVTEPLRFAAECISSAGFIGFAGLIAQYGFDALSYPLGIAAGLALMAILIASRFVLYPVSTLAGFFNARFASAVPRQTMLIILAIASVLLLGADIRGLGLAFQALTGVAIEMGIAAAALTISTAWLLGLFSAARLRRGITYIVLLAAFSAPLVAMSLSQKFLPLPYWTYGSALQDVAAIEQGLITQKLADFRSLKPLASPFLQLSGYNFAGIVLAIALGIAAMPQLLGRHLSQSAVAPGEATRRTTITTILVSVFLCGLAPFATFAREAIAQLLGSSVKVANLPASITEASGLGWMEVCGAKSSSAAEISAACAKFQGHKGLLRLQDISFNPDSYLFSAAKLTGLQGAIWLMLVLGAWLAALVAGHAVLAGFLAAEGDARSRDVPTADALDLRTAVLAATMMLAGMTFAAFGSADLASLAAEGLALIASSVFPVVLLALYWRRYNAAGAVASLVIGFVVAGIYIFGIRLAPVTFLDWSPINSDLPPAALRKFAELKTAVATQTDAVSRRELAGALDRHATSIANWWGLRPAAIVLLALPAALAGGVMATLLGSLTRRGPR